MKPKGRSTAGNASRQSSVAGDSRSSVAPIARVDASSSSQALSDAALNDMPPPTIVSPFGRETSPETQLNRPRAPPSFAASQTPRVVSSSSRTLVSSSSIATETGGLSSASKPTSQGKDIVPPIRSAPIPLTVGQTRSFPIHVEHPASTEASTSSINQLDLFSPGSSQPIADRVPMGPPPVQFEGFGSESELNSSIDPPVPEPPAFEMSIVTLNHQSTVKTPPQRKPGRKKKAEADEPSTADGKAKKPRQSSRTKKSIPATPPSKETPAGNDRGNKETPDEVGEPQSAKRKRRSSSVPRKPRTTKFLAICSRIDEFGRV